MLDDLGAARDGFVAARYEPGEGFVAILEAVSLSDELLVLGGDHVNFVTGGGFLLYPQKIGGRSNF